MQLILYALEECPVVANRLPTWIKPKLNYKQTNSINPNHVAIILKLREESTILNFCPFLSLIFKVLAKFLPNIFVLESVHYCQAWVQVQGLSQTSKRPGPGA